jgi:hypothetical protein
LKVPKECLFLLLVELFLRAGKALGSEESKALGSAMYYGQRNASPPIKRLNTNFFQLILNAPDFVS